jgi:hypothetical protein
MTTHTGTFLRPTLGEAIPEVCRYEFSKREAFRYHADMRMATGCALGSLSNNAAQIRRMARRKQAAMFRQLFK